VIVRRSSGNNIEDIQSLSLTPALSRWERESDS